MEFTAHSRNSPASEAGCEEGVYLHLIGGQHITGELSKAEVLHLLAAENPGLAEVRVFQSFPHAPSS